jgi:pentatricopeptide repeat protein
LINIFGIYKEFNFIKNLLNLIRERNIQTNVDFWDNIIKFYNENSNYKKVLESFEQMKSVGIKPNSFILMKGIKACIKLKDLKKGREIY